MTLPRDSTSIVASELQGTIVGLFVDVGGAVREGQVVALVESMKMHHEVTSPSTGVVDAVLVANGDTVHAGQSLMELHVELHTSDVGAVAVQPDAVRVGPVGLERDDLREVLDRHEIGLDEHRAEAIARRHARNHRTARENLDDLVDAGSFVEYGPLVIAAQRRRRDVEDLIRSTPADGLVGGLGDVNGALFGGPSRATKCVAVSYDYTVLAGTQGTQNHRKKDRLFEVAEQLRVPIVFFTEGGGGRPGDTDGIGVSGLDCLAFRWFAELSGTVPLVGIASGYCFAGNAAILGCCDVVIATEDANIGMGGPAMIEGGGLGVFEPTAIGPIEVQRANGVVDVVVADEAAAVRVAKQYLAYFQGRTTGWVAPDQTALRDVVPVDRLRAYDIRGRDRRIVRRRLGPGAAARVRRRHGHGAGPARGSTRRCRREQPDPPRRRDRLRRRRQGGAVHAALRRVRAPRRDAGGHAGNDGGTRRGGDRTGPALQPLVRRRRQPVGADGVGGDPEVVRARGAGDDGRIHQGAVRRVWPGRPASSAAWGSRARSGSATARSWRRSTDAGEREVLFREMVERLYAHGKAVSVASHFEIDDVIDPADTRRWITTLFDAAPDTHRSACDPTAPPRRPNIDTW